jgi:hypothetical protein
MLRNGIMTFLMLASLLWTQFEEVFLEKWGIKSEDIPVLLKNFEDIKQRENETLFDFQSRFEGTVAALYTPLGDVEEIFNPLGVSLGASES